MSTFDPLLASVMTETSWRQQSTSTTGVGPDRSIDGRRSRPLSICHLAKYYHPFRGGIETHVRSLARAQASLGHDVTVVCVNHVDQAGQDVWSSRTARTATVFEKDGPVSILKLGKFGTLARFDFCAGLIRFFRSLRKRFDLLHLHVPNPVMCVGLATVGNRLPLIVTYHSDIVKQRFIRKPFRVIEDRVFRGVDHFIVATQHYRNTSEVLRPYLDKAHVIPYGIDLRPYIFQNEKAQEFSARLVEQAGEQPIWLCVGRLVYYKGTEVAVRALAHCAGQLIIVGSGPDEAALKSLAQRLGVDGRIHWFRNLGDDELAGAYNAATALWFPSVMRSEAFGIVQIEAMASGCPVINTRIPGSGVHWVSQDGVSGLTVPVSDAAALAAAANRIANDRDLRQTLAIGAVERATHEFDLMRMASRTMSLYADVLRANSMQR